MAHHASAKKAIRKSLKQKARNKSRVSEIKTFIKKVEAAIAEKNVSLAQEYFKIAQSKIMRGADKNVLKANTASRKISRLANKIKQTEAA